MHELDPLVLSYTHLRNFPRAPEALQILRKVASLVKPLMRQHNWTVGELAEFYPDEQTLVGLNVNRGQKILLRLRYAGDHTQFLPLNQIADTMLHELVHIIHAPHDDKFNNLWNQLRDEHMDLTLKSYTGEHFLSEGRRLGGRTARPPVSHGVGVGAGVDPMVQARWLAAAAAERRLQGGPPPQVVYQTQRPQPSQPPQLVQPQQPQQPQHPQHPSRSTSRSTPRSAPRSGYSHGRGPPPSGLLNFMLGGSRHTRPPSVTSSCATSGYDDKIRRRLEEQAARNGFHTIAEEDTANDGAIAEALHELALEEERMHTYEYWDNNNANSNNNSHHHRRRSSSNAHPPAGPSGMNVRPSKQPSKSARPPRPSKPPKPPKPAETSHAARSTNMVSPSSSGWTCRSCTLHNPHTFLCCDACGTQRPTNSHPGSFAHNRPLIPPHPRAPKGPKKVSFSPSTRGGSMRSNQAAGYGSGGGGGGGSGGNGGGGSGSRHVEATASSSSSSASSTWLCTFCGRARDRELWSCDLCGKVKDNWQ